MNWTMAGIILTVLAGGVSGLAYMIKALESKMDSRLTAHDKIMTEKFETVNARFSTADARFSTVDARFDAMNAVIDARFDAVDARFDAVDARFDAVDARFASQEKLMLEKFSSADKLVTARIDLLAIQHTERN